jgi:hypothetical protein
MRQNESYKGLPSPLEARASRGRLADRSQNGIPVIDDLGIPKADHREAKALDLSRALGVTVGCLAMLAPIDLDDEPVIDAEDIGPPSPAAAGPHPARRTRRHPLRGRAAALAGRSRMT